MKKKSMHSAADNVYQKTCPTPDCHYPALSCYMKETDKCGRELPQPNWAKHAARGIYETT